MKIKNLIKSVMTLTGSSVLKMIQEESIPNVDLFVRESLQNSLDAGKEECDNILVQYLVNTFNSYDLANELEEIGETINNVYSNSECNYIAIKDTNTKGLLGTHIPEKGKDNNLYNLVYDMMTGSKTSDSGGSWGIGKSVYYRFGIGLCFYYSRTHEDGIYKSKLCGALIENENSNTRISKNETGIAFFGDLDDKLNSMPIYNEEYITKILRIFKIEPFKDDATGTIVIIPFVNINDFLKDQEESNVPWKNNIEKSLSISIQRWYFSRINNLKFKNGKYLVPYVNENKIKLNPFFEKLQKMYNLEDEQSTVVAICPKSFDHSLGNFIYRIFNKDELINDNSVFISHHYYFGNFDIDVNQSSIFYMRKPGMVLSYANDEFNKIIINKDEYLIGMFVLNDDLQIGNETLGQYFRNSEKASHTRWNNANLKDFPCFSKKKPYSKLKKEINNIINEKFGAKDEYVNDTSTSILKKKLGKLLLPPYDYGTGTSPLEGSQGKRKLGKEMQKIYFDGFKNGLMSFKILLKLKPNHSVVFSTYILANGKYSFDNWVDLGFNPPVKLHSFIVDKVSINKNIYKNFGDFISFDELKAQYFKLGETRILKYEPLKDKLGHPYGIKLSNKHDNVVECEYTLLIEPLDLTYSIVVDTLWERGTD